MHRTAATLLALLSLTLPAAAAPAQPSGAPHAWLYGTWTGGLFPVPSTMTALACLAQPTVIFTRDVVLRASITEVTFAQRVIETVRTGGGGTDFQFAPSIDPMAAARNGLLGLDPPKAAAGFGCETADVLHVHRRSETEIEFPGCEDFPNPLVRCPAR